MNKKALLLINVGSPDAPEKKAVKRFLSEFLNDKLVIDLPYLFRKILVNLIIIPFRTKHSTSLYKKLWTKDGSPLIIYTKSLTSKLNKELDNTDVFYAMRYGNPSLEKTLESINSGKYENLTILPLFPQYATSTSKSAIDAVEKTINKWTNKPEIKIIKQFYDNSEFIKAVCSKIKEHKLNDFDHILFSYHALPIRQINKIHPDHKEDNCTCNRSLPKHGEFCYKATCYETTRLLAKELKLKEGFFTTSFQSRMSKNWTKPFTKDTIIELAKAGKKNILIVSPAFVADCLETTIELAQEGQELFQQYGGKKLQLVENLNNSDAWVNAVMNINNK